MSSRKSEKMILGAKQRCSSLTKANKRCKKFTIDSQRGVCRLHAKKTDSPEKIRKLTQTPHIDISRIQYLRHCTRSSRLPYILRSGYLFSNGAIAEWFNTGDEEDEKEIYTTAIFKDSKFSPRRWGNVCLYLSPQILLDTNMWKAYNKYLIGEEAESLDSLEFENEIVFAPSPFPHTKGIPLNKYLVGINYGNLRPAEIKRGIAHAHKDFKKSQFRKITGKPSKRPESDLWFQ